MKTAIRDIILIGQKSRPEMEFAAIDSFFRFLSKYVSWFFIKLNFSPNTVTVIAIISSLFGGYFMSLGNPNGYLVSACFYFLFCLFDYCDGEVARVSGNYSISGHYLDYMAHFVMFASFMIGLSYGIYQYHSTGTYLILGFCGVAGILLRGIAGLVVSEVIIWENSRVRKRLPNSNQEISYSAKFEIVNSSSIKGESSSLVKKIFVILIRPSSGDELLNFFMPFSILIYFLPLPIINDWNMRIVDIYFFYLCSVNLILSFLTIYLNIQRKKAETFYNDIFGNRQ